MPMDDLPSLDLSEEMPLETLSGFFDNKDQGSDTSEELEENQVNQGEEIVNFESEFEADLSSDFVTEEMVNLGNIESDNISLEIDDNMYMSREETEDWSEWTMEEETVEIPNLDSLNLEDDEDWVEEGDENPFAPSSSNSEDVNLDDDSLFSDNSFSESSNLFSDDDDKIGNALDELEHLATEENQDEGEGLFDDIIEDVESDKNTQTTSSPTNSSPIDDDLFNSLTMVKPRPSKPK
jgi:hypothetical protein